MKYILFSLGLFLVSCASESPTPEFSKDSFKEGELKVRIIDSCEYLEYSNGNRYSSYRVYSLTHKGNCKYCKKW